MPKSSIGLIAKSLAVLRKDIRSEFRTRYALNAIVLFAVTTLVIVSFSVGQRGLLPDVYAALYWIIIFFAAMSGLAHGFVREEEAKTSTILRLTADTTPVYLGKLAFNIFLLGILQIIIAPLFMVLTDAVVHNIRLFITVLVLGSLGLAGATTLIAAIISQAGVRGALFAVLSFPVLLPLLIGVIGATTVVFSPDGNDFTRAMPDLKLLLSYTVIVITASLLLFDYVWQE